MGLDMTPDGEREYWDKAATDPDVAKKYIADVPAADCAKQIMPWLKPFSVLEIGCGIGRLTTLFAKSRPDWQLHGIDISPKMLSLTPPSTVKYKLSDGRTIPYPNQCFDSVYSMLVFQHISDYAKRDYIAEAARVLKAGGVFRVQYVIGTHRGFIDQNTTEKQMVRWFKKNGLHITSSTVGDLHPDWGWITGVKT